jgi:riboflavin synthase
MFTGIIAHIGTIQRLAPSPSGASLVLDAGPLAADAKPGDSFAVDGACLTIERIEGSLVTAQVVPETLERTTLGRLRAADRVNLELPLAVGQRLDGHFVQGHVDGVERLLGRTQGREGVRVTVSLSRELEPYVAPKGSIAVDGTSLTVVDVGPGRFSFALVPFTIAHTVLGTKGVGDPVNVEVDILAKYVRRMLAGSERRELDETFLAEHGFAG